MPLIVLHVPNIFLLDFYLSCHAEVEAARAIRLSSKINSFFICLDLVEFYRHWERSKNTRAVNDTISKSCLLTRTRLENIPTFGAYTGTRMDVEVML